jgi:hypothetical protein
MANLLLIMTKIEMWWAAIRAAWKAALQAYRLLRKEAHEQKNEGDPRGDGGQAGGGRQAPGDGAAEAPEPTVDRRIRPAGDSAGDQPVQGAVPAKADDNTAGPR